MLVILLALSVPIWGLVEYLKSGLVWAGVFDNISEKAQTVILQMIAAFIGIVAAFAWQVNAFTEVPQFATLPLWVAYLATGLAASGGSAFIHLLASFIGVRGGVIIPLQSAAPEAQKAGTVTRNSYAPWV